MTLKVTVLDVESGETSEVTVVDGDFVLLAAAPCYLDGVQAYPIAGVQVLTVRGWAPRGKTVVDEPAGEISGG